jgi:hypothetical protein
MARRMRPVAGSRGERVQQIKDAVEAKERRELTVEEFAARLNAKAKQLGLEERWSGPRFSKMVHGQEPALEDAAVLLAIDPDGGTWEWLVFGGARKRIPADKFRRVAGAGRD